MSDEIGNNNNIQNGDKKDDNPIQEEVKAKDYDIKPKKSLASIFFRKYNPTEGLYITQYSWDKDGGNVLYILYNYYIVDHRFKTSIHL